MDEIEISHAEADARLIHDRLDAYNAQFAPPDQHERLVLVVRRDGQLAGGLTGGTYWNWLYVEIFWVDERERGHGLGSRILARAEEIAMQRGCRHAHLETHDFQSLAFYQKRGYRVFGELQDLPAGHTKYYLWKELIK